MLIVRSKARGSPGEAPDGTPGELLAGPAWPFKTFLQSPGWDTLHPGLLRSPQGSPGGVVCCRVVPGATLSGNRQGVEMRHAFPFFSEERRTAYQTKAKPPGLQDSCASLPLALRGIGFP